MSRSSRGPPPASSAPQSGRSNEYFVPRDGIDREVITADICRYLGNDALVRPGHYENPQTGQVSQGYYITAYRNLTTAMIDDLKADSARWEAERRQQAARNSSGGTFASRDATALLSRRSNSPTAGYRQSETHSARQHYGPTDSTGYPDVGRDSYESTLRYPGSQAPGYSGNSAQGYSGSTPSYQQQPSSSYSSGGYPYSGQPDPRADPRYAGQSQMGQGYGEPPYIATAANMAAQRNYPADPYAGQPSRTPTSMAPPPGGPAYSSGSQVPAGYPTGYYPPSTSASYGSTPVASDPMYGRGAYTALYPNPTSSTESNYVASPAGGVAHPSLSGQGGSQYDKPPAPRGSAPPSSSKAQTTSSGSSHSRRSERDSDRHHQSDRHRPPRR
ncbi:transcription factor RfeG [Colletotrichum nymphaeae SA-01]|uniref:Transcription factor RfeG n=1 Tax=Colletotrichum nymphaeae SA-01 TaxID=1460502 RepID=A0A135T8W9_9PEZI|nr:transcription factor RfeG [Colletotrichum nymphaeae SA-01]